MSKQLRKRVSGGDYVGCAVLLFDMESNTIGSTRVTHINNETLCIRVLELPSNLNVGGSCRLLIMTDPLPCEYQGKIVHDGTEKLIALYSGRTREKRREQRFKVNAQAKLEFLIFNGQTYPLHTPIMMTLINVSVSGARFSAPGYTLAMHNKFQAKINISGAEKPIAAEVINTVDVDSETSEYGCRLLATIE